MKIKKFVFISALILISQQSFALEKWQRVDQGINTAEVLTFAFNPGNSSEVFASTLYGGLYKTSDHAKNWRLVGQNFFAFTYNELLISKSNPLVIYATAFPNGGLFKSQDGGENWEKINEPPLGPDEHIFIKPLGIHPTRPQEIYINRGNYVSHTSNFFYKTIDGGQTWEKMSIPNMPEGYEPSQIIFNEAEPNIRLMQIINRIKESPSKLLRTTNNGETWEILPTNMAKVIYAQGAYYGLYSSGIFKSTDNGTTWSKINFLQSEIPINIVVNERNLQEIYITTGTATVYKTVDEGKTWQKIFQPAPASQFKYVSLNPNDLNEFYLEDQNNNIYHSDDSGKTVEIAQNGFANLKINSIAVDPNNPKHLFAGTERGLWIAQDGEHWQKEMVFAEKFIDTIVIDPTNSATIYVGIASSPEIPLYRSDDNGKTWIPLPVKHHIFKFSVTSLAVNLLNRNQLYAIDDFRDVFRSEDGGKNWIDQSKVISADSIIFNPANANEIFAIDSTEKISKSLDDGKTWSKLADLKNVRHLEFDPLNTKTIYAHGPDATLFKSIDNGVTWAPSHNGLPPHDHILSLVFDPKNSQILYAATADPSINQGAHGVFVSYDGGEHWKPFNEGIENGSILTLAMTSQGQLFAGTDSTGIYKINTNSMKH